MPWGHKWLNREMKEVEERRGKGERDQKGDILNRLYWSENRNVEMKLREREIWHVYDIPWICFWTFELNKK